MADCAQTNQADLLAFLQRCHWKQYLIMEGIFVSVAALLFAASVVNLIMLAKRTTWSGWKTNSRVKNHWLVALHMVFGMFRDPAITLIPTNTKKENMHPVVSYEKSQPCRIDHVPHSRLL
jgi:hypothetical protein